MIYGYAHVSTMGQARDGNSFEAQVNALRQAGAERIFRDIYSRKPECRPQLDRLLKVIENGGQAHHNKAGSYCPQSHSVSAIASDTQ